MECLSPFLRPLSPQMDLPLSVTHGQCDARPTVTILSSLRASLLIGQYQFILLGEQRHMCVNNLPRVIREAEQPGLEPATYWLQVRRPNHYATTLCVWSQLEILDFDKFYYNVLVVKSNEATTVVIINIDRYLPCLRNA